MPLWVVKDVEGGWVKAWMVMGECLYVYVWVIVDENNFVNAYIHAFASTPSSSSSSSSSSSFSE